MTGQQDGDITNSDTFGLYRAEYLRDDLFKLYKRPGYFPELETDRPCVLVGGRGTGKTTVLRCLAYDGRFALEDEQPDLVKTWKYFGFYYRVNTNRVTAFRGADVPEAVWQKAFGHYVNLLLCGQVAEFLGWLEKLFPADTRLESRHCEAVAESLGLSEVRTVSDLVEQISKGRRRFEAYLNSLDDETLPPLSLQGQPIDELCAAVRTLPILKGKSLYFVIDEFENLLDYQQEIFNTLIKHSGENYIFKIGVRELGWRRKSTLNPSEQLISPADYELIDIASKLEGSVFEQFASEVCRARSERLLEPTLSVEALLPSLSLEEEAQMLGVDEVVEELLDAHRDEALTFGSLNSMRSMEAYFVGWWAKSHDTTIAAVLEDRKKLGKAWEERFENYKFAILYTIKKGKAGVRKYYAGWSTYLKLADGNIRYLLELVAQARLFHQRRGQNFRSPVSALDQTRAAQEVGEKNLRELEGLSVDGAQLTKLLLGLGRIFEVMANEPEGHAPEVTQFHLPDDAKLDPEVEGLLSAAVMHMALVRSVSNKRTDAELKSYDFAVHPIFAPFFGFSHRKKRKMKLTPQQFALLVRTPRTAIRDILAKSGRSPDSPLPAQLQLFEGFYGGSAG